MPAATRLPEPPRNRSGRPLGPVVGVVRRRRVPEEALVAIGRRDPVTGMRRTMPRRHLIMLALAAEVLFLGYRLSDRYRPPGIAVEPTLVEGHVIT